MRYWLFIIACFAVMQGIAQKQKKSYFSKQFSLDVDNDAFMLKRRDGYYTQGIFLQLSKASEKEKKKIIERYELGQTMFTTGSRIAVLYRGETIDRPYCGYLYAKYAKEKFLSPNEIFSWNVSLGVTGKWALAENLQNFYHKIIGLYDFPFWDVQIPNSIGVNAGIGYKNTLISSSLFKIVPAAEANLGMFYVNAKAGAYFCLGNFENNDNSALFNTSINNKERATKRKEELFVYCYPQIMVQAYNATMQGTMFYNTKNAITSKPNALLYQQTFGIAYSKPIWTAKFETNFQTKETALQNRQNRYGSIHFSYRFN